MYNAEEKLFERMQYHGTVCTALEKVKPGCRLAQQHRNIFIEYCELTSDMGLEDEYVRWKGSFDPEECTSCRPALYLAELARKAIDLKDQTSLNDACRIARIMANAGFISKEEAEVFDLLCGYVII